MTGPGDGPDAAAGHPAGVVPLLLGAHWHTDQPGGLPRYFADLLAALRGAGLHPRAAVTGPAADAPVGVAAGGRLDEALPVRLARYALAARRASAGVDVVDAHFALYAFLPTRAGRLRRLPLVVHFQGPWSDESLVAGEATRWRLAAKRTLETAVYRRARVAVVLSAAFKALLVERYGVAPWSVEVIPPGVDLRRFQPGDRAAARAALGLGRDDTVIVAVRRLVPRMGLDVLVEAWAEAAPGIERGRLLIVGDGPEEGRLRALAAESGAGRSVGFLTRMDDRTVVRCYQAADLSVVPSLALEGFGLVVLESLACGTPVIVTDAGGLPEAVAGLDRSLVVPAGDHGALAARLAGALDGTAPVPDPGACRRHAEGFGWPEVARRHAELYRRVAAGDPGEDRRLRVVYLDHCARLSGGELALLRLLPKLEGVDAHVVLGEDGPLVGRLRAAGVSVEVHTMDPRARSLARDRVRPGRLPVAAVAMAAVHTVRVARRLRRLRPDLVHTNSLKAALYGGVAGRLAGVPVVWHVRDRIADDYLPRPARRLVQLVARALPSAVIANSATTLASLGPGLPPAAVVPSPLATAPPVTAGGRGQAGPLRVGMVGRLAPWKGQHVFLEAFARAFPGGDEQAVVVGDALFGEDTYRASLDELVARLGLVARVEFRGFVDDVGAELARLDALVHASTVPEPFGQVVVEGMAAGLPVVAAAAGGPAEVIADGVDGLLYPPGDVDGLAGVLRRLAADPALRLCLGEAARSSASRFTAERVAPEVTALYRRVLEAGGTRRRARP